MRVGDEIGRDGQPGPGEPVGCGAHRVVVAQDQAAWPSGLEGHEGVLPVQFRHEAEAGTAQHRPEHEPGKVAEDGRQVRRRPGDRPERRRHAAPRRHREARQGNQGALIRGQAAKRAADEAGPLGVKVAVGLREVPERRLVGEPDRPGEHGIAGKAGGEEGGPVQAVMERLRRQQATHPEGLHVERQLEVQAGPGRQRHGAQRRGRHREGPADIEEDDQAVATLPIEPPGQDVLGLPGVERQGDVRAVQTARLHVPREQGPLRGIEQRGGGTRGVGPRRAGEPVAGERAPGQGEVPPGFGTVGEAVRAVEAVTRAREGMVRPVAPGGEPLPGDRVDREGLRRQGVGHLLPQGDVVEDARHRVEGALPDGGRQIGKPVERQGEEPRRVEVPGVAGGLEPGGAGQPHALPPAVRPHPGTQVARAEGQGVVARPVPGRGPEDAPGAEPRDILDDEGVEELGQKVAREVAREVVLESSWRPEEDGVAVGPDIGAALRTAAARCRRLRPRRVAGPHGRRRCRRSPCPSG